MAGSFSLARYISSEDSKRKIQKSSGLITNDSTGLPCDDGQSEQPAKNNRITAKQQKAYPRGFNLPFFKPIHPLSGVSFYPAKVPITDRLILTIMF
jgi:hypothetical protein